MLSSSTRKRARGNIRGPRASLELRIDGLSFGRVRRLHAHRLEAFRLPVDRRDLVRRLQEVLRGLQVDLLPRLRAGLEGLPDDVVQLRERLQVVRLEDRKSTRLNSSHVRISYAVFCLKKKKA